MPSADLDRDGDVDSNDVAMLQACRTGPGIPYDVSHLPPSCTCIVDCTGHLLADLDGDDDVDQDDFGLLQRRFGTRPLQSGVGLNPRTFDSAGFYEAFEQAARVASVGLVQIPFSWDVLHGDTECQSYRDDYDWLLTPLAGSEQNFYDYYHLKKAMWVNFLDPSDPTRLNVTNYAGSLSFTNPVLAQAFKRECVWIADHFSPDYLALGTEIDGYLEASSADERLAFLSILSETISAIRQRHYSMTVFVYFQYEHVQQTDLWEMVTPFANVSDVYAFSTYPSLPMTGANTGITASQLPDDYYAPIRQRLGDSRPIAFVELGHPSASSGLFSSGCEQEQASFVQRFFKILPPNTSLVTWTYLYDATQLNTVYPQDVADYFSSMGLSRSDTENGDSPGLLTWQQILMQP